MDKFIGAVVHPMIAQTVLLEDFHAGPDTLSVMPSSPSQCWFHHYALQVLTLDAHHLTPHLGSMKHHLRTVSEGLVGEHAMQNPFCQLLDQSAVVGVGTSWHHIESTVKL